MSKPRRRATKGIRVEPRTEYDAAIVNISKDGKPIYCYRRLVDATMRIQGWERSEATQWVDRNVLNLPDIIVKFFN